MVVGVLAWSYGPELQSLWATWGRDPNYSHGYLVVPVAAWILAKRLRGTDPGTFPPAWWAWLLLTAVLVARAFLRDRGNSWGEAFTILPAVACLTMAWGGTRLLGRALPALAFLTFMFPLPPRVDEAVARPLQSLATTASVSVLKATGLWVAAEGNVILVGQNRLEVANACNGLSMALALVATVAATVLVLEPRRWKSVVLLLSALPVALLVNIARICVTAWCYSRLGASAGERLAHDLAGWLMMPVALAVVGLELLLLNRLVVEEETENRPTLLGKPIVTNAERAALRDARAVTQDLGPGFDPLPRAGSAGAE